MRQDLIVSQTQTQIQKKQQQDINYNNNQMFIPQLPQQQQTMIQSASLQQIKSSDEIAEQYRQHTW